MKVALTVLVLLVIGTALFLSRPRPSAQPVTGTLSPTPAASLSPQEEQWQTSQATSNNNDVSSLEKDINGTVIQNEDFSDLK